MKNKTGKIDINSDEKLLEARSIIYGAVSALFSDPECEKFSMIMNPGFQRSVLDACLHLDKNNRLNNNHLTESGNRLLRKLDETSLGKIQTEYVNVFGHTLSKQIAPYELEHLKNSDVFFKTQKLADLSGFYGAFGVEVQSQERADHISTQTEFLSYLIIKELLAIKKNLDEEKKVCQLAFIEFKKEHFSNWTEMFSENLSTKVEGEFYPIAGRFLKSFLEQEPS